MGNLNEHEDENTPTDALDSVHEADLTKGMEHMRFYVSVPSSRNPKARPTNTLDKQSLTESTDPDVYGVPGSVVNPPRQPSSSRDPSTSSNPQKRTDPFQFGSRYLEENDDIFEFNAWDHVQVDDAFKAFAEEQFAKQRANPASEFHRNVVNTHPEKAWNRFYSNNAANFFKNRKWLFQEFPILEQATKKPPAGECNPVSILEIGAGAGNTAFPLLAANQNPDLRVHAVDFSSSAVDVMKRDPLYDEKHMQADVWDLSATGKDGDPALPPTVLAESIDIAIMVFVLSALEPSQWTQALKNVSRALKPGGEVLFRDYGRGDLAQVRFKKERWMADNFYVRGDGTRVYFFDEEELREIWRGTKAKSEQESKSIKFDVLNLGTDRRMLVNRQRKLKMYRCWMQGRFRKPCN